MCATTRSPASTAASYASRVTPSARAASASSAASRLKSAAGHAAASASERPSRAAASPERASRKARPCSASTARNATTTSDARRFPGGRRERQARSEGLRRGGRDLRLVVELRQPAELLRQGPVLLAQELHRGGEQHAPGDRRVGEGRRPEGPPRLPEE